MRHDHHHDHDSPHAREHDFAGRYERGERRAHRHDRGRGRDRSWGSPRGRGFGGPFEGGRRAGRGDVRAAILALLAESPMHGYQVIQEIAERSNGAWTPSPGSVYPALQMLQDEGLVSATESDGKRVFTLTDTGRTEAAARGDGPLPWEAAARGERGPASDLRSVVMQVAAAVRQIGVAGSDAQIQKAIQLLGSTRRELYRILAEDDTDTTES
ncbi:MAG TPA: PadR family transcriptional regulator [Mycobacteriales bacterium]|nr:PadR family transcriptional regulator [Mycobacteriales bacterium]